ncbi:MAG TPA: hypothetical protein GXX34_02765, partial [Clostridia bacterium]|nr:hypothetical protein [Clostridia bacterium]
VLPAGSVGTGVSAGDRPGPSLPEDNRVGQEENPQVLFLWVLVSFLVLILYTLLQNAGIL